MRSNSRPWLQPLLPLLVRRLKMRQTVMQNAVSSWRDRRATPAASLSPPRAATFLLATRASGLCSVRRPSRREVLNACLKLQQTLWNRTQSNSRPSILLPAFMGRFPYRDIYRRSLRSRSAKMLDLVPNRSPSGRVLHPQLPRSRYGRRVPCTTQAVFRRDHRLLGRRPSILQHHL